MLDKMLAHIDASRARLIDLHARLVAVPALGPDNMGDGEAAKAELVREILRERGIAVLREMPAPDARVPGGLRPNIAARIPGKNDAKTLWVISHIDVVPPGDPALWSSDPWKLTVEGDHVIGRGVEDNHQAVVSSLLVAEALLDTGEVPPIGYGMVFVSDEETGSKYGLDHVVREHADLFRPGDLFLVPDFGSSDSCLLEIAEKGVLWLKVTVLGQQCHASTPAAGNNSLVAAAAMILKVRTLYEAFPARSQVFDPPHSTFEPTKKEANVENVNTLPGRDVFYVDCRVMPEYRLDDVLARIKELGAEVEAEHGVKIEYDIVQKEDAAPATPADSEIVRKLSASIESVYGVTPTPKGIGGGTVAAVLRRNGHHAAVWSTLMHNAHQPNEKSSIAANIGDAKVMARMLFEE